MTMLDEDASHFVMARSELGELAAGVLHWIPRNLGFLDPASTDLPPTSKVKAALELALFCRIWARLRPADDGLAEVAAMVRRIWQSPDFSRQVTADPAWARQYALIYAALAPPGLTGSLHQAAVEEPADESPYLRLETRYYAELAGIGHQIESYAELFASSILAGPATALPISKRRAYNITHTVFYLSDFGLRDPGLARAERERALGLVCQLTDHFVRDDQWDLGGELALTQFCLGGNPADTPSGVAAIKRLRQIQLPNGAIPARSAAQLPGSSATAVELFWKAYHTTLVAGLLSLVVSFAPRNS
jgi:hypothetical protein